MSKTDSKAKIAAAEAACGKVFKHWDASIDKLSGGVSVNGAGVFHERGREIETKLREGKAEIEKALAILADIEWPSDADFDVL